MSTKPNTMYTGLQQAYDLFNKTLFGGVLPSCVITLQRKAGSVGYFASSRLENKADRTDVVHEIALNPMYFESKSELYILSILVHEMCHVAQVVDGTAGRVGYHNQAFASRMEAIGLVPSHTGKEGGRRVGQKMSHYVQPMGMFDVVATTFLETNTSPLYQDRASEKERVIRVKKLKVKYTCLKCHLNVWGKAGLSIACLDCRLNLTV